MTATANVPEVTTTTPEITTATKTWTRATVYKQPEREFLTLPPHNTIARFTDDFLAELERETCWKAIEDRPSLPEGKEEALGTGAEQCPLCMGSKEVAVLHKGEVTGVEMFFTTPCVCEWLLRFWTDWKHVPARFRAVRLSSLMPRSAATITEERQAKIISFLQAHPEDSYILHGPPGTGKTHFSIALYRKGLEESVTQQFAHNDLRRSVWRISTSALLNEHTDWERRDQKDPECAIKAPSLTERMITDAAQNGYRPRLFLDEIDKIAKTDFKLGRLCEIVNAVYEANGQVIATANKDPEYLATKWGDDEAGTILRRIGAGLGAYKVPFVG